MLYRLLPCLLLFTASGAAIAQDDIDDLLQGFDNAAPTTESGVDALLEGFDDTSPTPTVVADNEPQAERFTWLNIGGYTSLSQSINYQHDAPAQGEADFRGLSRLRYKLSPEAKAKLPSSWQAFISGSGFYDAAFEVNGREQYADSYLDEYESEVELRELWISGTLGSNFDLKIGRQIVPLGKSDTIRVVDVINPLDMREPGMVDIEDLRLPVTMIRADYYFSNWSFSLFGIPEIRQNKLPAQGSDFYPIPFPMPPNNAPENWENLEFAAALSGEFSGWDLSFHLASTFEDQPHFSSNDNGMQRGYARVNMFGVAENLVVGSWLYKFEYAIFEGLQYFATGDTRFMRSDMMLGFDYNGITDHTVSLEALWSYILDYDDALEDLPDNIEEHGGQIAIRYTGNFLRETLQIVGLASLFGIDAGQGAFYRGSAKYSPGGGWAITGGVMVYQSGDSPFLKALSNNDRVFAEVRYDF